MNQILAMPLPLRLAILAVVGAALGALANWLSDRARWEPSLVSPWRPPRTGVARRPAHYVPIWGWLSRHDEQAQFGRAFWVRPFLVELLCAAGLPCLYWFETVDLGLIPTFAGRVAVPAQATHLMFASHATLIFLMLIASLVDLDEKIIPDSITIPGTLVGIMFAALAPRSLLPDVVLGASGPAWRPITLVSPHEWPAALAGKPHQLSLAIGLACLWIWAIGLMPRVWRTRRGWGRALGLFWGRLRGEVLSIYLALMGIVCSVGVVALWSVDGRHWRGLLTALVGMALTGGLTWLVRFVAGASIGREALGFGDVTLMSLIGAFLGWQAGLMIFFLAPFFGLLLGVAQWVFRRETEIPYGPFLCLAALLVLLRWSDFWEFGVGVFQLGWLVLIVLTAGIVLMGVLLSAWHWLIGR